MVQKVRNLAPVFNDEDTADDAPGIQVADREVAMENAVATAAVGEPVVATDIADADGGDDAVIFYLLSGADAASFDISTPLAPKARSRSPPAPSWTTRPSPSTW